MFRSLLIVRTVMDMSLPYFNVITCQICHMERLTIIVMNKITNGILQELDVNVSCMKYI